MFRKNTDHLQPDLFELEAPSSEAIRLMIQKTEEYVFYRLIFSKIEEADFACLYCNDNGRPNSPVNCMISALILKERHNWSYSELFKQLHFNLAVRAAIGIFNFGPLSFNEATLFNFQNRLRAHFEATGVNLFELVFNQLTRRQVKELNLKTSIARTDSFMINSNIRRYGRMQLLLEVVLRLYRVLSDSDKAQFKTYLAPYLSQNSEHYLYHLHGSELPHEFEKLAAVYYRLHHELPASYEDTKEYRIFQRAFREHFHLDAEDVVTLIPAEELGSGCLQSPDDEDATYRRKRGTDYRGFTGNVIETAHPDNPISLITDVSAQPNNVDDSKILADRLDVVSEVMPDVEEFHFDGGYGSQSNDELFEEKGITPVQTAVRGRGAAVEMVVEELEPERYEVTCPGGQAVEATATRRRHKVLFDKDICANCPFAVKCPSKMQKKGRVWYFDREYFLAKRRHNQILKLPPERRKLRPNVETAMYEFVCGKPNHKLTVRGLFKANLFVCAKAISVNFGRIKRLLADDLGISDFFGSLFCDIFERYQHLKLFAPYETSEHNLIACLA